MDKCMGCFIGGLIGDAMGATLEFRQQPSHEEVLRAMKIPGQGVWNVAPGQVTDDSELMFSLFHALVSEKNDPKNGFPFTDVAKWYRKWFKSSPFDIGGTCFTAFSIESDDYLDMMNLVHSKSIKIESNGALMRCAPIAYWARQMSDSDVDTFARQDCWLSHPNEICQDVNGVFCVVLKNLMESSLTHEEIWNKAVSFARHDKTKEWIISAGKSNVLKEYVCSPNTCHVKHAFILAMHCLKYCRNLDFTEVMYNVLLKGGDTDTHACIVGYIMGAMKGIQNIPEYMQDKILQFECDNPKHVKELGHLRPSEYASRNILDLIK